MNDASPNPRAVIGGNAPPPSPYERAAKVVNDIFDEVTLWLDGHKIDCQATADGVGNLLAEIRKAEKIAKAAHKTEKAPLDKAVAEVQARYNALFGDNNAVKGKLVIAAAACKAALQPWLDAEDRRIKEEARIAREEADRQRAEAEAALRASEADNLAERAAAEALLSAAKKAETVANKAGRETAKAGGAFGNAIGLRTVHMVSIDDPVEAARHVWAAARHEMIEFLVDWAERQVRQGARSIPGFEISEKKVAA